MSFRVLDDAQDDAVSAARWYEERQAGLGNEFLDVLEQVLNRIQQSPDSFPAWEQSGGLGDVQKVSAAAISICGPVLIHDERNAGHRDWARTPSSSELDRAT